MKRLISLALIALGGVMLVLSHAKVLEHKSFVGGKNVSVIQSNEPILTPLEFPSLLDTERANSLVADTATTTHILVTGDVLPAREVNNRAAQKNNWNWPYEKTADRLRAADITVINLETPLVEGCQRTQTGMVFCGDPQNVEGLLFAGVDVAALANNHALNQGEQGFLETVELLERNAILPVGDSAQPKILEKNGTKFAFLAYNDIGEYSELPMAGAQEERVRSDIMASKELADAVIVLFHWGEEYRRQPTRRQEELAHLAIESGAEVVLGNHPHWFQAVEMYKNKLIAYSHGNFVFDQMWSMETRQGVVGEYIFEGPTLVDVVYHPAQIEDYGQPRWLEGEERGLILEELRRVSLEHKDEKSSGDVPNTM